MSKEELKVYLKKRLQNCKIAQERNKQKNIGLGGFINTPEGIERAAYLGGKITIIQDILKLLDEE